MRQFLLICGVLFGTIIALQGFGLVSLQFWGPRYEEARRNIYDESRTFQEGTMREVRRLCEQHTTATNPAHKAMFRRMALDEMDKLTRTGTAIPADLRGCF